MGRNAAQAAAAHQFDAMRARILLMLEAAGLDYAHEVAVKELFKTLTYDTQAMIDGLLADRSPDPFKSTPKGRHTQ